jgi:3-deoxy-alpha-D-manno-octulosonate 8-oxidase
MNFKNFPLVSKVVFGRGSIAQLNEIISPKRKNEKSPFIYLIDDVFENNNNIISNISLSYDDYIIFISSKDEPKTSQVDNLVEDIILKTKSIPSGIIGIGGGTLMDLAKAVSLMLTNNGSSDEYQGWDLIKNPAVYHVGIPTISGTGAEVSRTTVLNGPKMKLGINSDFTPFDQVILDPELTTGVKKTSGFTQEWIVLFIVLNL